MDFLSESQSTIINSFINTDEQRLLYLAAPGSVCEKIPDIIKDCTIIDLAEDFSPFKPFLTVLSQYNPDPQFIHKYAYSVQEESFLTFLKDGYSAERYDIPIQNETLYETNRFIATIISLIKELNNKTYLILNAQNIFEGTIRLLKALEKTDFNGKFLFVFNSDKVRNSSKEVLNFLEEYNNARNFLFLNDSLVTSFDHAIGSGYEEMNYSLNNEELFACVFKTLRNNRIFMNYNQLKYILEVISKNIHRMNFSDNQKRLISFEMALAYIYTNQQDEAILLFNEVIAFQTEDEINIAAHFYLTMLFYSKKSNDMAKKYSLLTSEKLKGDTSSPYYALHQMIKFQFTNRKDTEELQKRYQDTLQLLKQSNFHNNYLSTGLSVPWDLINHKPARPVIEKIIEECYQKSKLIDNQHLVSKACHWKGIMYSHYGEGDKAMYWYNECNRIRTEIGEIGPILNIRNGLSYESSLRAMYKNSYNLVNDVIKNLYNISDYSTVIDTLKNIGYALFYSRHFDNAAKIFTQILHYLNIFGMEDQTNNSFLPSTGDMLIFMTIINLDKGDYVHGKTNYSAIAHNMDSITMEDKPLVKYILATLYIRENAIGLACDAFDECIRQFYEIKSNQSHKMCFCCYEFADILTKAGDTKNAQKYLALGYSIASENRLEYYTKGKTFVTVQDYFDHIEQFDPLNIDLAFLNEKAEKEVLVTQLHKRLHDYQFLNKLKASNGNYSSFKDFISNAVLTIYEYCVAEFAALCEFKNGSYQTICSISRNDEIEIDSDTWKSTFVKTKSAPNCEFTFIDEGFCFGNLSQFDYRFGMLIQQSEKTPLTADTLNTLNIALSTIQAQITIFKQNENLMFLSTTDQLSLLNNRRALNNQLNIESEKIIRSITKNKIPVEITIAFMDLDNFKYYNDNFGHGAGDLLINRFAKLLKETCRQTDFIARFGGDEFVIVMNDTSIYEVVNLFDRIKENLARHNFFIPDLEALLNVEKIEVENGKLLGFSMGISTNYDIDEVSDLETVLSNADKALYYTKEHCKGHYSVWEDVKRKG